MPDAHKNLAISAVATAPSPASSGTSLIVTAGQGTRFPAAPFHATVWPINVTPTPANAEIVRVTNISTDTLTITRAQEGTSARSIIVGDQIAATITNATLTDIERAVSPWSIPSIKYPADNTGSSSTTSIINQALSDADAAGGGDVTIYPGDYLQNGTINVPNTCNLVSLGGRIGTRLFWTADLGAGTYAIDVESAGFDTYRYPSVIGFDIDGPGNEAATFGTQPCNQSGVLLNSNAQIKECGIHGFGNGGINYNGNHQRVDNIRSYGNYYGIYFASGATNFGNQTCTNSELIGNRRAAIGIHGSNFMDAVVLTNTHMGWCPYIVYIESGGTYGYIVGSQFYCWFEEVGNGVIYDADVGAGSGNHGNISNCIFESYGGNPNEYFPDSSLDYKITAEPRDYAVTGKGFSSNVINHKGNLSKPGAIGIYNVVSMSNVIYNNADTLLTRLATGGDAGKKFCNDSATVGGVRLTSVNGSRFRMMKYSGGAGDCLGGDVLYHGEAISGVNGCSKQMSDIPVGVTYWGRSDGNWVPVCFEGQIGVNCQVGGTTNNYLVQADLTNRGKVILTNAQNAMSNAQRVIGFAESGTAGGTATVFITAVSQNPVVKAFRTIHTFALKGAVTNTDTVPPFFISMSSSGSANPQLTWAVHLRYKIRSGTPVTFRLLKNGAEWGYGTTGSPLTAGLTVAEYDATHAVAEDDEIELDIVGGGPATDMSVTLALEHVI